jgi:hypothetical protein
MLSTSRSFRVDNNVLLFRLIDGSWCGADHTLRAAVTARLVLYCAPTGRITAMISLFGLRYRANFCAECGNERSRQRWWQHRYLCAECARRFGYVRRLIVVMVAIGLLALLLINRARREEFSGSTFIPATSIIEAGGDRRSSEEQERPARVACGARTRRGTPCRHLVAPGERCAQHRGQKSMLSEESR